MTASYYFLPWVRSGMAALITEPRLGKKGAILPGATSRVTLPLTLQLNEQDITDGVTHQLYGPGDVVGIDAREVIRTGPRHLTPDYAPERFAFIEFDRPDFPWMFTPAARCNEDDCLLPWIVLVVIQKNMATLSPANKDSLPILTCELSELSLKLNESWAWAHAQYVGDLDNTPADEKNLATKLEKDHCNRNLSRLLCPRKLAPYTSYVACLVPAFEAGRQAGLGGKKVFPDFDPEMKLAHWEFMTNEEVKLPVYYSWEFSTGEQDRFIELATKLRSLTKDELAQTQSGSARQMDLSHPLNGMGEYLDVKAPIPSALRIQNIPPPPANFDKFRNALRLVLLKKTQVPIPPPVYGGWHTPPGDLAPLLDDPNRWLGALNLDPSYRVAAALGTCIVQQEQESLVAAAWEQVQALQQVNQFVRQKQFARSVTDSIYKNRLSKLSPGAFLQITEPLRTAKHASSTSTQSSTSPEVPVRTVEHSVQYRRMTRSSGPRAMKRSFADYDPDRIAPPPGATEGARQVSGYRPARRNRSSDRISAARDAADSLKKSLLQKVEPRVTFASDVKKRICRPATTTRGEGAPPADRVETDDPLRPVTYAPSFPQPMFAPLLERFPDMLLPGLDKIPNDRATLLETDARFIEAYLVGLNHELSREFLWREFPTLVSGTYFQQFWDASGAEKPEEPEGSEGRDIPPIVAWKGKLGENLAKGRGGDLTFLLLRSELLVRYPQAMIYAYREQSPDQVVPVLRLSPTNGVTLLGFHLINIKEWKFCVEEHFTEPHFGTDDLVTDNAYVSFQQETNGATAASDHLKTRYWKEIKVMPSST